MSSTRARDVRRPGEPGAAARALASDAEPGVDDDEREQVERQQIPAAVVEPRSQAEVRQHRQRRDRRRAPRTRVLSAAVRVRRASAPHHRQAMSARDLQLAVRDGAILKQLPGCLGRDDEQPGLVEQDEEQQRQQPDRCEIEGDRDRLVIASIEEMRGGVQARERQPEHEERRARRRGRRRTSGGRRSRRGCRTREGTRRDRARSASTRARGSRRSSRPRGRRAPDTPNAGARPRAGRSAAGAATRRSARGAASTRDAERRHVDRRPGVHRPSIEIALQVGAELERRLIAVAQDSRSIALSATACSGSGTRGSISTGSLGWPALIAAITASSVEPRVRRTAAQQLVQDDAERVDVRARVDRLRRVELLRCDVVQRPLQMAALG